MLGASLMFPQVLIFLITEHKYLQFWKQLQLRICKVGIRGSIKQIKNVGTIKSSRVPFDV